MKKIFLILLTLLSILIAVSSAMNGSLVSLFFLPVPAYFIATLLTNSDEFSLAKQKKAIFYYVGLIVILSLISIKKFI